MRSQPSSPRLRGSGSARKPATNANRPCPLCERNAQFHLHCQVCRAPLEGFNRKTCPGNCKQFAKSEKRKARTVLCWIIPANHPDKKYRRWLPKRLLHTGVSGVCGARRRTISKGTNRNG